MSDTWWAAAAKQKLALALMHAADVLRAKDRQALAVEEGTAPCTDVGRVMNADISGSEGDATSPALLTILANEPHGYLDNASLGNDFFFDSNSADYWSSLGLDLELDVADNII
jgi:hypothetical protein